MSPEERLLRAIFQEPPLATFTDEGTSMLEIKRYARKPFLVDAVQVTKETMQEVAKWCDGEVRTDEKDHYVKVRVHRPANENQTKAKVGHWILYAGTGYKVYTPKAFKDSFELAEDQNVPVSAGATE